MNTKDKSVNLDSIIDSIVNTSSSVVETVTSFVETAVDKITNAISDINFDIGAIKRPLGLDTSDFSDSTVIEMAEKLLDIQRANDDTKVSATDSSSSDSSEEKTTKSADDIIDMVNGSLGYLNDQIAKFASYIPTDSALGKTLQSVILSFTDGAQEYKDGISETSFGSYMENSWDTFLSDFSASAQAGVTINFLGTTPLNSGSNRDSLFGTMMLGCPFLFNDMSDPNNRAFINSLVKDGKFLSLTPGMPKYNGGHNTQNDANSIYKQTKTSSQMISYLLKNGLDSTFNSKDKRYYTFESSYEEYFAYLETMLNTIWVKLGLANSEQNGTFNLLSFFNVKDNNKIKPDGSKTLLEQYQHSIGFFVNPASAISESVNNSKTGFGIGQDANNASDNYQKILYLTGMGTGGAAQNSVKSAGMTAQLSSQLGSLLTETFSTASSVGSLLSSKADSKLAKVGLYAAGAAAGAVVDVGKFAYSQDLSAVIQSFQTTNGMKVAYPELWSDSQYSKNINLNFSFVSPYGDPMSIFRHVYVPFCALLCFALPRQAAANGYVSPFFVRADIPGLLTSDLALISDITWTKGGGNNLWTKDGLPRAIDCSITITDLYEFLAMTKRLSYLSANPSYTVFLDNMAGMCRTTDGISEDSINEYFGNLIDRVNGVGTGVGLWNKNTVNKRYANEYGSNLDRPSATSSIDRYSVPWLHNSSLT